MTATPPGASARSSWRRRAFHWLWRGLCFFWGVVVVGVLINVASTWLTSSPTWFPGTPVGWMLAHLLLTGVLVGILLVLTFLVGSVEYSVSPHTPSLSPTQHNRRILLKILHSQYTKSQPLRGQTAISLTLRETFGVTHSPSHLPQRHEDRSGQHPLEGTSLLSFYEESGNGLLLLGEPGAGKSALLLDLARALLERARQDETHPMPVLLPLSSWATSHQPLDEWLVEELLFQYHVPRSLGYTWLQSDQLLLLLDGLDEVIEGARSACVEAINTYREGHFAPLVACSRSQEYLAQPARLALPGAVTVVPLTRKQVTDYLQGEGASVAAVLAALHANPVLYELTTTPLMLSVVVMAYRGEEVKDLPNLGSLEEQRRRIFAHYITRMLGNRKTSYAPRDILAWLSWLAQQMNTHHRTVFYLERLQPNWLPDDTLQQRYTTVVSHVIAILYLLVVAGLGALLFSYLGGPSAGFLMLSLLALMSGPMSSQLIRICNRTGPLQRRRWMQALLHSGSPVQAKSAGQDVLEIQPTETLSWSRFMLRLSLGFPLKRGLIIGLVGGLVVGSFFGLFKGLGIGLIVGTTVGAYMLFTVLLATGLGLSGAMMEEHDLFTPNQGIRNSLRYGLLVGLFTGVGCGLFAGCITAGFVTLVEGSSAATLDGVLFGLWLGCCSGMVATLLNGAFAAVLHLILRYFLWRARCAPLRYVHFLDYATERILLARVGGGYSFIHPLFRDHFASLGNRTSSSVPQNTASQQTGT
jgi:hypothetical protein